MPENPDNEALRMLAETVKTAGMHELLEEEDTEEDIYDPNSIADKYQPNHPRQQTPHSQGSQVQKEKVGAAGDCGNCRSCGWSGLYRKMIQ